MTPRALLPSLTLTTALFACSGSTAQIGAADGGTGDAADAAPAITIDQAAAAAAAAYCNRAETCGPLFVSVTFGDAATCASTFKGTLARAFAAAGVTETPEQLEACAAALPQVSCADLFSRKSTDACKPVPGTLVDGAACASDGQCTSRRCRVAKNQVCGTCGAHGAPGAPCGVDDDCDYGAKCLAASGTCVAYGNESATCDASHPCRPDLGCVGGVCGAASAPGVACASSDQCDQIHGVFCNPLTKQCETATLARSGASCGLPGGHFAVCAGAGLLCTGVTAPNYVGACMAPAAVGAACDTANGPACTPDAVCVCAASGDAGCTGVCTVADATKCK